MYFFFLQLSSLYFWIKFFRFSDFIVCMLSCGCATLSTVAHQAPLSLEFSRQEYWSGLPCPPPGIFLTQGSKLCLLGLLHCQAGSLPLAPPGKPLTNLNRDLYEYKYTWRINTRLKGVHIFPVNAHVCTRVLQSFLTLCDLMNPACQNPLSMGFSRQRILEWVAVSFSGGSSQPRDWTHISCISCIGRGVLYHWHHLGSHFL